VAHAAGSCLVAHITDHRISMLGTAPVIILFMKTLLTAERLWDGSRFLQTPFVVVENGVVVAMASRSERELPAGGQRIDLAGATLAPAFFDVHIHGAAGHDVMEATSEALNKVGRFPCFTRHGTVPGDHGDGGNR